jgi:hypothetical protein
MTTTDQENMDDAHQTAWQRLRKQKEPLKTLAFHVVLWIVVLQGFLINWIDRRVCTLEQQPITAVRSDEPPAQHPKAPDGWVIIYRNGTTQKLSNYPIIDHGDWIVRGENGEITRIPGIHALVRQSDFDSMPHLVGKKTAEPKP